VYSVAECCKILAFHSEPRAPPLLLKWKVPRPADTNAMVSERSRLSGEASALRRGGSSSTERLSGFLKF
jgi:hypothetical protein